MNARRAIAVLAVLVALAIAPHAAHAEIQKSGSQEWPGKIMLGVHPIGVQAWFNDQGNGVSRAIYKLNIDIAGIIAKPGPITVWLGGGFNVATAGNRNDTLLEPWIFVILSFERLIKIPLVPFVRVGVSGGVIPSEPQLVGVVGGKFGAGMHYWLTKNIGLGFETNFFVGTSLVNTNNGLATGFAGFWDFGLGARFAF